MTDLRVGSTISMHITWIASNMRQQGSGKNS